MILKCKLSRLGRKDSASSSPNQEDDDDATEDAEDDDEVRAARTCSNPFEVASERHAMRKENQGGSLRLGPSPVSIAANSFFSIFPIRLEALLPRPK